MASRSLKASVIIGGAITGAFRGAMSQTKDGLKAIGEEIVKVERKQRLMAHSIDSFRRVGRSVEDLQRNYAKLTRDADRLKAAQQQLANAQDRIARNNARRQEAGGQFRGAVTTFGVVAAATLAPVRSAVAFESAMLGVAKQVNGARDSAGNLTPVYFSMAKQVQKLGREIPIATNELALMVAAGARMGVANDELIGFTRTAAMMADAFELPAGQLADDMGKIAGLFHIPIPKIGDLADAINYLDDNAISKGGDIIDVMRRIGGMAATLRMPEKEAAALGSTFLTLGSSAEVAGTASNAVMRILGAATAQSKRVRNGLASIGFKPEQIQADMAKDATGTIIKLLDKLNSLNDEQRMVASTRIFGAEYGDDIAKLATGADEYKRQLALVRSEQAKGSMSREFEARLKTTSAQWQITKNRMSEVAVVVGGALLPAINDLLKTAAPMIEGFAEWSRANPGLVKGIIGSALALTGLRVVTTGVAFAWAALKAPVLSVMGFIAKWRMNGALASMGRFGPLAMRIAGVVRTVGAAIAAIGGGPIALAVAALTVGALIVRKYWEPIKAFFSGLWQGFAAAVQPAMASVMQAIAPLKPVWDMVSGAIGEAWDWFMRLIAPAEYTSGELSKVAAVGKVVGAVLANSFKIGAAVIGTVVDVVVWLGTKIGETAGAIVTFFEPAFNWLSAAFEKSLGWIIGKIDAFRAMIGVAGSEMTQLRKMGGGGFGDYARIGFAAATNDASILSDRKRELGAAMPGAPGSPAAAGNAFPFPAPARGKPAPVAPAVAAAGPRGGAGGKAAPKAAAPQYNFNITQLPGESGEQLARRVVAEQKRQESVDRRGALADEVG